MDDNPDLPDEERGLYAKYLIIKIPNGIIDNTIEVVGDDSGDAWASYERVTDPGMFLKFDDKDAQDALWVYANLKQVKYPKLAEDIKEQITQAIERYLAQESPDDWKGAVIALLNRDNIKHISEVCKTPAEKLQMIWKWCWDRDRYAYIHYGPGWFQIMEVDKAVNDDSGVQKFVFNHESYRDVPIGEKFNWSKYEDEN